MAWKMEWIQTSVWEWMTEFAERKNDSAPALIIQFRFNQLNLLCWSEI